MTYRYNTIDIIVAVGLCAIIFGAWLFFAAASGTLEAAVPEPATGMPPAGDIEAGMTWLQPAFGHAIVEQAIFERHANQVMAQSASEWNRATLAHHGLEALPGGPLGAVMHKAATIPADHAARVQGVLGRAIVNFTRQGIRSGALSGDPYRSGYNLAMIRATESRGKRLADDFASTWQATLGREIVHAVQTYRERAGAIQEQLGTALVHVVQAQAGMEDHRATKQEDLGSFIVAAARGQALADRLTLQAAIEAFPEEAATTSTSPASWPEIPIGYLMAASLMLVGVFFSGLTYAARSRETKALADLESRTSKWVYRPAA